MRGYIDPGFVLSRVANPLVVWLRLAPTLIVAGRRSGVLRTVPFGGPFEHRGARYLVSGRGLTDWARNLRAAGEGRIRARGKDEPFRAVEVKGAERDTVLAAYRDKFGASVHRYFELLPNADDHPVFRIEAM